MKTLTDLRIAYDRAKGRDRAPEWAELETARHAAGIYDLALLGGAALRDQRDATDDPERRALIDDATLLTSYDRELLKELQAEPTHDGRMRIRERWRTEAEERYEAEKAAREKVRLAAEAKVKADAERREKAENALIAMNRRQKAKAEQKPLVRFSKSFMRASCEKWDKPEERRRKRNANVIMRRLFENWRAHKKQWIPEANLSPNSLEKRIEKALSADAYPRTFTLLDIQTNNKTGKRKVRLSESYDYVADA